MPASSTPNSKKVHKIKVDRDACISAATCVIVAPKAFDLDEEELAIVLPNGEQVDDDALFKAAQSCPTQAIMLLNADGEQIFPKAE